MVFCNMNSLKLVVFGFEVTILILIDGFLQYVVALMANVVLKRHNPYFNRWFSAIHSLSKQWQNQCCHNPYFNRWFSAIS